MSVCVEAASPISSGEGKENVNKRPRLETVLHVKRLSEKAVLPTRGSPYAAGYDLYRFAQSPVLSVLICASFSRCVSAADVCIPGQGKMLVPTDLALAIPHGCYGRIGKYTSVSVRAMIARCFHSPAVQHGLETSH